MSTKEWKKKIVEEKLGFDRGCVPVSVRIIDLLVTSGQPARLPKRNRDNVGIKVQLWGIFFTPKCG